MSSAYRIFINGNRVATAVLLDDGKVLQTYPHRDVVCNLDTWVFWSFWDNREESSSYTLSHPDGSKVTYSPERYVLKQAGHCVSAGKRIGLFFIQTYPLRDEFMNEDSLLAERAPLTGVPTLLEVKSREAVVTPAPARVLERPVSYWLRMTDAERHAWRDRMRLAREAARERRAANAAH